MPFYLRAVLSYIYTAKAAIFKGAKFKKFRLKQTKPMSNILRKRVCFFLKIAVVLSSLGGVFLSLIFAKGDGYSHWSKRLLYFTAQSNLWVGITFLALLLFPKRERKLYILKYVFTVSITVTGLVFCCLLAPFSDDSYHPWSLPNLLTHVLTPVLAVVDFFLDRRYPLSGKQVLSVVLPLFFYFGFVTLLELLGADFGRGVPYPYFFFYYRSPAGIFGFSQIRPFFMGSFYWLAIFLALTLGLGVLYGRRRAQKRKKKHTM